MIQIEGEEFLARACITSITVGERTIEEATNGDTDQRRNPRRLRGHRQQRQADRHFQGAARPGAWLPTAWWCETSGNRVGEAKLTIPEPEITLDPMTSQRGSTVTVVGKQLPCR